jgi:hypothetical protein
MKESEERTDATCIAFTGGQLRLHEADFKLWPWLQRHLIVVSPTQQGRHTKKHLEDTLAIESEYLNNYAVNTTAGPVMQDLRVGTRTVLTILKLAGLAGLAGPVFLSSAAWSDVPLVASTLPDKRCTSR